MAVVVGSTIGSGIFRSPAGIADRVALSSNTFADEARFFSARRARRHGEERFGLLLSAIGRRADGAAT